MSDDFVFCFRLLGARLYGDYKVFGWGQYEALLIQHVHFESELKGERDAKQRGATNEPKASEKVTVTHYKEQFAVPKPLSELLRLGVLDMLTKGIEELEQDKYRARRWRDILPKKSTTEVVRELLASPAVVPPAVLIERFRGGLKEGEELRFHPNGQVSRCLNYHKGELDGECRDYDEQGNPLIIENYRSGTRHGEWRWLSGGGTAACCYWKHGKLAGPVKSYYADGQEESEFHVSDSALRGSPERRAVSDPHLQGSCFFWYPGEHRLMLHCNFHRGCLDGEFWEWDRNGKLISDATFDQGDLISAHLSDPNNALLGAFIPLREKCLAIVDWMYDLTKEIRD